MSQSRRSSRKKRQTQLSFTPLPSSSPATSQYPEDTLSSPTKKRRIGASTPMRSPFSPVSSNGGPSSGGQKVQVVISSLSKNSGQLPTPAASSQVGIDNEPEPENKTPWSSELSEQNIGSNSTHPIAGANVTTSHDNHLFGGSTTEGDDDIPIRSARRTRPAPIILSSEDSEQSQTPQKPVTPMKKPRIFKGYPQTESSRCETDSEAPTKRLRQKLSISPLSTRATNGVTSENAGRSEARKAKKIAKPVVISDRSEDSSSEDVVATPVRKRKAVAQIQSPAPDTDHEEVEESPDDLQEEVEDLRETNTSLRNTRTRAGPIVSERSRRQQKLEELKRRRAGIKDNFQEEDEQNDQDGQDGQDEQRDLDEADLSGPEPIHHAMRRGGNLDQYEYDFVDDEDDKVGVDLGVAGVPLEFTYHANKKPFEHFKAEIEWMVHNKLNPAFDRFDEMYKLAHRKLDKEVEGFAGSKFSSSVWSEEFSKALKARPDLSRVDVPTMLEHKCDACRRSKHPPKHQITFSGKLYNRDTLETVEHDDEDEDDDTGSSDDGESSNTQEVESFFVGRFCCANAEMAHALHHWRYALNQSVLAWLAAKGHLSPAKVVERENLRQKKRQKATNKIVDGMENTGVMRMLFKQFKENLAAARDAKPERFSNAVS